MIPKDNCEANLEVINYILLSNILCNFHAENIQYTNLVIQPILTIQGCQIIHIQHVLIVEDAEVAFLMSGPIVCYLPIDKRFSETEIF